MSDNLTGTWQLLRAELDGEAAPELVTTKTKLVLTDDTYEVLFNGQPADRGTYEIDAIAEIKTIILHGNEGPNAGRTIPCIYRLVGDRLRVCYGLNGFMPRAFSTAPGQQRYLATYRRRTDV